MRKNMEATPECWIIQELTECQLNEICTWLMRWQSACVSADTIAQDFLDEGDKFPSQLLDPNFKTAMLHVESLIRHIGAIRKCQTQKDVQGSQQLEEIGSS